MSDITGFGASYWRDEDAWVIYAHPDMKPFARLEGFVNPNVEFALTALRAALDAQPPIPLAEVAMRERAARALVTCGDSAVVEALGQRLCCNGQYCGCEGAVVEDLLVHEIRNLPTTFTHAELLAAAMQLPEVKALVDTTKSLEMLEALRGYPVPYRGHDLLRNALAPFGKATE